MLAAVVAEWLRCRMRSTVNNFHRWLSSGHQLEKSDGNCCWVCLLW